MKPKPTLPEPERWCERSTRPTAAENTIGAAFRRVREATEPSEAALERLAWRMDRPPRPTTRAQLVVRVALATALVMAMGGAVGAALKKWRHSVTASGQAPASDGTVGSSRSVKVRRGQRPASIGDTSVTGAPAAAESTLVPPLDAPPVAAPTVGGPPVQEVPRSPSVTPPATAPVHGSIHGPVHDLARAAAPPVHADDANSETRLLGNAFRKLRSDGDAASALRSLDQYDHRFPNGMLRSEARIARAEALMTLDRGAEALPLLEGIEEEGGALTRNVRITRGELLVEDGRCANALRDFNAILASTDEDAAGGRALYGRASCALLAGDIAAARRDLQRYLLRHPDGGFATAARHALDLLP
jgi:hypothetical protein